MVVGWQIYSFKLFFIPSIFKHCFPFVLNRWKGHDSNNNSWCWRNQFVLILLLHSSWIVWRCIFKNRAIWALPWFKAVGENLSLCLQDPLCVTTELLCQSITPVKYLHQVIKYLQQIWQVAISIFNVIFLAWRLAAAASIFLDVNCTCWEEEVSDYKKWCFQ